MVNGESPSIDSPPLRFASSWQLTRLPPFLILSLNAGHPQHIIPSARKVSSDPRRLTPHMKLLTDCFDRTVRLTDERLAHIVEHPEMKELEAAIERVLLRPQLVRRSRSDEAVKLFYEYYAQTSVGGKWLCVVVKYDETDAFVVTAYLTDKPKAGEDLWPRK